MKYHFMFAETELHDMCDCELISQEDMEYMIDVLYYIALEGRKEGIMNYTANSAIQELHQMVYIGMIAADDAGVMIMLLSWSKGDY